jgi:hypothetical protein
MRACCTDTGSTLTLIVAIQGDGSRAKQHDLRLLVHDLLQRAHLDGIAASEQGVTTKNFKNAHKLY